ncbi:hypothetical protein L1987_70157 [Smallanthus sonchifolius]|uniref:Uncharacterized protein n=1 Tax=Smallanthus sonchifolius TaxID=185202 RepID=A0ACB9AQF7_9ASTR|nr:hypothetical protein L1987_70157 [Smallanthus sonchifolius]
MGRRPCCRCTVLDTSRLLNNLCDYQILKDQLLTSSFSCGHSFLSMTLFMAHGSIMKLRYSKKIPWGGAGDDFVVESTTRLLLTLRLLA